MPDHDRLSRRARTGAAALVGAGALLVAGCGPLPPEAPVDAASVISRALTSISSDCGESYRQQAFIVHPNLSGLESSATDSAKKLATISRRHPEWVYQAKTLSQIDSLTVKLLHSCSLPAAARVLPQ